ncbi:MAG: hypothetical protein AB7J32_13130 [Pseudonocardia sp.]
MSAAARTAVPPAVIDREIDREIDRLRRAGPFADGLPLARAVTAEVLRRGRHHLGRDLLTQLDALSRGAHDRFFGAHLDAVLARRRDRFRGSAYLALPLLELIRDDHGLDHARMAALLMADVVRHERRPTTRCEARTRELRIAHAARFVADVEPALGLAWRPGPWFALSALPVSAEHDEYTFLRALQAQEMLFAGLTHTVRDATQALREADVTAAVAGLDDARAVLGRATLLLRLVATTRRDAFRAFRRHTETSLWPGTHHRFAVACTAPDVEHRAGLPPRLDSFTAAHADIPHRSPAVHELDRAVVRLEGAHQRWRAVHDRLTTAMLGADRIVAPYGRLFGTPAPVVAAA